MWYHGLLTKSINLNFCADWLSRKQEFRYSEKLGDIFPDLRASLVQTNSIGFYAIGFFPLLFVWFVGMETKGFFSYTSLCMQLQKKSLNSSMFFFLHFNNNNAMYLFLNTNSYIFLWCNQIISITDSCVFHDPKSCELNMILAWAGRMMSQYSSSRATAPIHGWSVVFLSGVNFKNTIIAHVITDNQ